MRSGTSRCRLSPPGDSAQEPADQSDAEKNQWEPEDPPFQERRKQTLTLGRVGILPMNRQAQGGAAIPAVL